MSACSRPAARATAATWCARCMADAVLRAIARAGLLCASVGAVAVLGCGSRSDVPNVEVIAASAGGAPDAESFRPSGVCQSSMDCPSSPCAASSCVDGRCSPIRTNLCNDDDPCTEDICDSTSGACKNERWYVDQDGDGVSGPRPRGASAESAACGTDCDDQSALVYPGAAELCDGVDNDCDGEVDEHADTIVDIGSAVQLTGDDALDVAGGDIAFDGMNYAANYGIQRERWVDYSVHLDRLGRKLDSETPISTTPNDALIGAFAWSQYGFAVTWSDRREQNYEVYFNLLDSLGAKLGPDLRVSNSGGFSIQSGVLVGGDEYFVVFADEQRPDYAAMAQRVGADGARLGDLLMLTPEGVDVRRPRLAQGTDSFALAFYLVASDRVGVRVFDRALHPRSDVVELSEVGGVSPSVVWSGDRYVVAYGHYDGGPGDAIWGATLDEDGNVLSAPRPVTAGASFARTQSLLGIGANVLLVWADDYDEFGNYELYAETLDASLTAVNPRARVTETPGATLGPSVVLGPGGDVGLLYEDEAAGTWSVNFSRLGCYVRPQIDLR